MQPTKKSLSELFDQQRLHVVPLFQRPYVWSKVKQWEPLWDDIEERALAVLEQTRSGARGHLPAHFLGAIVTSQVRTYGREIDKREVIDGQQRLTTLQVFLAAFRDFIVGNHEQLHAGLVRLTENSGVMESAEEKHKVWPTNVDREVFKTVMTAGSPEALEAVFPQRRRKYQRTPDPRAPLVEAYLFFHAAIRSFCSAASQAGNGAGAFSIERADALFEALRRHIQLVHIDLEDDDDPQVIFETLNARGEPLLPSDLIRNFLFLRASRQKKAADTLYATWWRDFDERPAEDDDGPEKLFWKRTERQGRYRRPRLDLFLFHYLQLLRGREIGMGHLYQEFRGWWEDGDRASEPDVEVELQEMRRNSDGFASFFAPTGTAREAVFARRLKVLDTSTVYPLALFLLVNARKRVVADDVPGILADLESYLVRRMVTGATTKNYNRFFLALLVQLRPMERITRDAVRSYLAGATGDSAWPDDRGLENAWLSLPAYDDIGAQRVAMVLEALELDLRTSKQEGLPLPALTVEHIMPQEWNQHWPEPEPLVAAERLDEDEVERRNRLLHTFGNLTLLTRALNGSVSNGPFAEKRPEIARQSELRLNCWFQDHPQWDERSILERGRSLLAVAKKVWPGPA